MFKFKNINVLVIGADGMLGGDVLAMLNGMARTRGNRINRVTGLTIDDIDITDKGDLENFFANSTKYGWCVNCAAYTNTVKAEKDGKNESYAVNALACKNLAEVCREFGTKLLHVSTDYVFSENSQTTDDPFPTNNYGMHKLLGEMFIRTTLKEDDYCIVRTSWLYGARNSKSFVHKFVKNLFNADKTNRKTLADIQAASVEGCGATPETADCIVNADVEWASVTGVDDQFSIPTSTEFLSEFICSCIETNACGILSGVPIAVEKISRYEFARKIFDFYNDLGLLDSHTCLVRGETDRTTLDWPKESILPFHGEKQSNIYQEMSGYLMWDSCLVKFLNDNGREIWDKLENA